MNQHQRKRIVRLSQGLLLATALAGCAAPPEIQRPSPTAAKLATRVKSALVAAKTLDAATIFVDANGSNIRLTGFTDTAAERRRAARVAHSVAGVIQVENRIKVRS
jgi:osmotically-inducible protein OsmY